MRKVLLRLVMDDHLYATRSEEENEVYICEALCEHRTENKLHAWRK